MALELTDDAVPLTSWLAGATCLAIGHEDRGLQPGLLAACDAATYIPQLGRIGSLNVATATAIALYDVRRRSGRGRRPKFAPAGGRGGPTVAGMEEPTVRTIREDEIEAFLGVQRTAMLYPPPTERDLETAPRPARRRLPLPGRLRRRQARRLYPVLRHRPRPRAAPCRRPP